MFTNDPTRKKSIRRKKARQEAVEDFRNGLSELRQRHAWPCDGCGASLYTNSNFAEVWKDELADTLVETIDQYTRGIDLALIAAGTVGFASSPIVLAGAGTLTLAIALHGDDGTERVEINADRLNIRHEAGNTYCPDCTDVQ